MKQADGWMDGRITECLRRKGEGEGEGGGEGGGEAAVVVS